jgi:hypothetical protein
VPVNGFQHIFVFLAIGGLSEVHKLGADAGAVTLAKVVADDVGRLLRRRGRASAA